MRTALYVIAEAPSGVIGIGDDLRVFQGYDMHAAGAAPDYERPEHLDPGEPDSGYMTIAEKVRLADIIIERWQAYRAECLKQGDAP
jgi:hypothetical protein